MDVIAERRRSSGGGPTVVGPGGGVRSATCRSAPPGWSEKKASDLVETVDAIARWIALVWVLILVYGTIQDLRKWLARRRKSEERAAALHEAKISRVPEKNEAVRGSTIDDLVGTKG